MGVVITYDPSARGPGALAKLVWCACGALMAAARQGETGAAERNRRWLWSLREDLRCTPPLARLIDGTLSAAARRLSGPPQPGEGGILLLLATSSRPWIPHAGAEGRRALALGPTDGDAA